LPISKLDLRKTFKSLYSPRAGQVELIRVPAMKYIMMDGSGAPEGDSFHQAIGTMYNLAYTMKFRSKKLLKKDYSIMALEGLWWIEGARFELANREDWLWTLMIVQPDFVTDKMFSNALEEVRKKKNPPGIEGARLESFEEGLCVQTMHIGPYSTESRSIARLEAFAKQHGYTMVGKHHEIYLGDPRRAAPSKLKTIIRHPVVEGSSGSR
jgi:hypothetical protein